MEVGWAEVEMGAVGMAEVVRGWGRGDGVGSVTEGLGTEDGVGWARGGVGMEGVRGVGKEEKGRADGVGSEDSPVAGNLREVVEVLVDCEEVKVVGWAAVMA